MAEKQKDYIKGVFQNRKKVTATKSLKVTQKKGGIIMRTQDHSTGLLGVVTRKIFLPTVILIAAFLLCSIDTNAGNKGNSIIWKFLSGETFINKSNSRNLEELFRELKSSKKLFPPEIVDLSTGFALWSDGLLTWDMVDGIKRKQYKDQSEEKSFKVSEINQKYVEAYYNRGWAYFNKGQYDLAIKNYNKAIELNPKFPEAYNNRGNVYLNKGQIDQAIKDFNMAIEIEPTIWNAYYNRGTAYVRKGQYDLAIKDFNKTIEINPKFSEAYNNRGYAYFEKEQYALAIKDFNMAIEINPKLTNAYDTRGLAYFLLGKKVEGCASWKKACELGECRFYNDAKQTGNCP
jgi:tetratricopeptide (TPR) repeat protein